MAPEVCPEIAGNPELGKDISVADVARALQENEAMREERVRQLFLLFEPNNRETIDVAHLEAGFQRMKVPSSNCMARELLQICDRDANGEVDFDEFVQFINEKEVQLLGIFRQVDASQDLVIKPDELRGALSATGVQISDDELRRFMSAVDSDRDGSISFAEWRNFLLFSNVPDIAAVYTHWEKVSHVDIGEQAVIPEGISRRVHPFKYLLAGAVAGAVSRTATAPLDRLKVLFQVQTQPSAAASGGLYKNLGQSLRQIYRDTGWTGFFRGNGLNVLKVGPESALKFYMFELFKRALARASAGGGAEKEGLSNAQLSNSARFVAGGAAGAAAQALVYPIDLVKTRLQTLRRPDGGCVHKCPSFTALAGSILVKEGPFAFYRGLAPSLMGMIPYAGIDLALYEGLRDMAQTRILDGADPGPWVQLTCGTISGAVGATCVYPLQLVRTRMAAQPLHAPDPYKNTWDVLQRTVKQEGVGGLYRGLRVNLLKVIPAAAITYVVYERMKIQLGLKHST